MPFCFVLLQQLSIKFDDPLTTTFEYPSETSLLNDSSDEMTNENLYNSGNNHMNNGQSLLNSVGLGNYTDMYCSSYLISYST